ncbi:MAG: hypothetical protein R3324_06035, partial [Halobacteriales archaeon]|nr:hypothetical protein [Halobacteriales archaeon]
MVDRRLRVLSLLIVGLLSAGALISWYLGELFPWIHVFVYMSVMLVVLALGFDINGVVRYYWSLAILCVIGVLFRVPMVLLPGTLSGNDPEKYALFARLTLLSRRYVLPDLDFYGTAGAFHTYVAQTSAITGIVPEEAMVVFGLFIGIWAPLIAASFCLSLLGRSEFGYRAAILAGSVATVAAISVQMSFVPFAQSLGTILLVTLLFVVIKQIDVNRPALGVVILVLAAAMAVSHKLPLVVATPVAAFIWLTTRLSASDLIPWLRTERHLSFWIVVVLAAATVIQQYVITSFLADSVLLAQNTISAGSVPQRTGVHPNAASVPNVGILETLTGHSHAPVTLLHAGLSWLLVSWVLIRGVRPSRSTVVAFLVTVASLVALVIVSVGSAVVPEGVNPFRMYALVELLLAGLIGVGIVVAHQRRRPSLRALVMLLLVLVLVFNGFSAASTPDFPSEERQYLTPEEMTAKRFAVDHVPGEIYSDDRYVRQTPYPERVNEKTNPWLRLGAPPRGTRFNGIGEGGMGNHRGATPTHPLVHLEGIENELQAFLVPDPVPDFSSDPLTLTISDIPPIFHP